MAGKKQKHNKKQSPVIPHIDKMGEMGTDNKILKIQNYIYNNSKKISYIAIAVIVGVVLIFVIKGTLTKNKAEKTQKAMTALSRIMPYYNAPDFKRALFGDSAKTMRGERVIGLLDIIDKYSGTDQAILAALYAGNSYLTLNKADEAIEYFEEALDSKSNEVVQAAYAGLGSCYDIKGDLEKAADNYQKASDLAISDNAISRYSYYAARDYEKLNKKEKAEKIYNFIINKGKFSEFANYAKAGLVRLGIKID